MTGKTAPPPEGNQATADALARRPQDINGQEPTDPFDPALLHIGAMADVAVEAVLTTVPVRNPKRNEFFRVHPDPTYSVDTAILEVDIDGDRESFLVLPAIQGVLSAELRVVRLTTAITKRGNVFLWPIKLPTEGNNPLRRMADSALQAADQAKSLWVKVAWDRELGAWGMARAKGELGTPQWPDKSFRDLIAIAFRTT